MAAAAVGNTGVPMVNKRGINHIFSTSHFSQNNLIPPIENACRRSYHNVLRPINSFEDPRGHIIFQIEPQGESYLMCNSVSLEIQCKIVKGNGEDCDNDDIVAPVNNLFGALFKDVTLRFNETTTIGQSSENVDIKSMIETALSFGGDARDSHLTERFIYLDTPGQLNNFNTNRAGAGGAAVPVNEGFLMRYNLTRQSKRFELFAPVNINFLRTDKYLCPGTKLDIVFTLNPWSKMLMSGVNNADYKLKFIDFKMHLDRIKNDYEFNKLKIGTIERYNFTDSTIQQFVTAEDVLKKEFVCQSGGIIPCQMYIVQVASESLAGNYARSAYNFQPFNIKKMYLRINGEKYPADEIEFDFSNPNQVICARGYNFTMRNCGILNQDKGCSVNKDTFKHHQFIMAFDITPDKCNSHHVHESDTGEIILGIEWREGLPEPTTILVLNNYNSYYVHKTGELPFIKGFY